MSGTPQPDGLLTVAEAARVAGVSRATIKGWIDRGHLSAQHLGARRYVRVADLCARQRAAHLGPVVPAWRADPGHGGRRLRTLREAAGLTQLALAAASGLSHESVSLLESGRQAPGADTVRRLARALRCPPERFVAHTPLGPTQLTAAEAARRLDVPLGRLRRWLQEGRLPGTKVSGQWRVLGIAVAELAQGGRLRGSSRRLAR